MEKMLTIDSHSGRDPVIWLSFNQLLQLRNSSHNCHTHMELRSGMLGQFGSVPEIVLLGKILIHCSEMIGLERNLLHVLESNQCGPFWQSPVDQVVLQKPDKHSALIFLLSKTNIWLSFVKVGHSGSIPSIWLFPAFLPVKLRWEPLQYHTPLNSQLDKFSQIGPVWECPSYLVFSQIAVHFVSMKNSRDEVEKALTEE